MTTKGDAVNGYKGIKIRPDGAQYFGVAGVTGETPGASHPRVPCLPSLTIGPGSC